MTRFSEIAHDIESQFDPDYDIDPDSGAPPVRYIEHRLLELCETLDARLTALEAKPQATTNDTAVALASEMATTTRLMAELAAARTERDNFAEKVEALTAERDNLKFSIGAAAAKIRQLTAERDGFELAHCNTTKERNALATQLDVLSVDNKNLREGNAELRKHYTNKNDLCAALQKQNVTLWDDNAGLRKDNERLAAEVTRLKGSIVATVNEIDQDLATDNAQLRQDNALMMADKRQLRAALEAVEYDGEYGTCLWCSSLYGYEHFQNCQRQAALR